jgi:hypothetical protein
MLFVIAVGLLPSYGFTIHDNPYLGVDYWVKVPPTARDAEWKANLLQSSALTGNQTYDFQGTIRPGMSFFCRNVLEPLRA